MPEDTLVKHFKDHKYVIVENVLSNDKCRAMTEHIQELVLSGKTIKDPQCPLSNSIYGDKLLDELLEELKPAVESATGLRLNPTYSYARKYAPGDELKPHLDRDACEISATLTLGLDGEVWPIHISSDSSIENDLGEFFIAPGSMAIYRGKEINHWREKYTQGNWQCQVFLHYVDADGPHADLKYDGREELGGIKKSKETQSIAYYNNNLWIFGRLDSTKYLYTYNENFLSDDEIEKIISFGAQDLSDAGIGDQIENINKNIRNVSHRWLPYDSFDWLYQKIENEIRDVNWWNFKFKLESMENIDYLEYHSGGGDTDHHGHGKYTAHVDGSINSHRKLSFSIMLTDPSEFDGGDLLIYADNLNPVVMPKKKGQILFFPSNCLHEVTPVTRGVRRSAVSWVRGPLFT